MSTVVSSIVRRRIVGSAVKKSVLLHMADSASDDGSGIWTSKANIARDLELSKRAVQLAISDLAGDGLISECGEKPCKNGFTVEYRIDIAAVERLKGTRESGSRVNDVHGSETGESGSRVNDVHPHPCTTFTPTRESGSPKPSLEPSLEPSAAAAAPATADPTFRERLIEAAGGHPSGINPTTGRPTALGGPADMVVVSQWQGDHGLTEAEILAVIRDGAARKSGAPPSSLRFFAGHIADYVAAKRAGTIKPQIQPDQPLSSPAAEAERQNLLADLDRLRGSNSDAAFNRRREIIARLQHLQTAAKA